MDYQEIIKLVEKELDLAKLKYPKWPSDPIHAIAIAWEEKGELIQASIDHLYPYGNHKENDTLERMTKEALQMICMGIRFLENIESYNHG